MATAATSLLGLALPVTGELSGTWGDTVNVSITALLDTAVAGTTTLSSDADVTLTTTTLAANQARQAIILWTAGGTVTRTITVPAQSKSYIVINKTSSSQSIKIVGVGPTTGVTIVAGTAAFVVWNGVDFVTVSVTSTTGILPVANGGTGLSSGTSGGVLAYTATGTLASSTALAANALVIGGGAGAAPSTTTTGTGVVTALGVNTGTAGAFVVNGGALGTPSSGTVTNLTGTANITVTGGASGAIAATTLSATGITTLSAATTPLLLSGAGSSSTTLPSNYAIRINAGVTAANYGGIFFDGSTAYDSFFGRVPTALSGINDGVGYVTYASGAPTLRTLFSSTGLAVTGTLSATDTATFNKGATAIDLTPVSTAASARTNISWTAKNASSANRTSYIGSNIFLADGSTEISGEFAVNLMIDGVTKTALTSTGLAVTGTLSATGDITLSGTVGRVVSDVDSKRVLIAGGSSATTTTGAYAIFEGYDFGGAGAGGAISLVSAAGTTNPITMSVGGTTRGVFSSAGLAVTGALSASSNAGIGRVVSASTGLIVRGLGTTSATRGLVVENSSGTELLVQTDEGNLGVGTSSPSGFSGTTFGDSILDVKGVIQVRGDATNGIAILSFGGDTYRKASIYTSIGTETPYLSFSVASSGTSSNSVDRMMLDTAGNLGLGVAPSAWNTSQWTAFEGAYGGALAFYKASDVPVTVLTSNAYNDGGWKYKTTDPALQYEIDGNAGIYRWYTATSGTAGNAISFGDAKMTLTALGELLVGDTSPTGSAKLCVAYNGNSFNGLALNDTASVSGAGYSYFQIGGTTIGSITRVGATSAVIYNTTSDYRLKTVTGAVTGQGARIDALKPIDYIWIEGGQQARGFLAHEFQAVYSNSVTGDKDAVDANGNPKHQSMQASTSEVIADLVAELQSLRARVAQLESKP